MNWSWIIQRPVENRAVKTNSQAVNEPSGYQIHIVFHEISNAILRNNWRFPREERLVKCDHFDHVLFTFGRRDLEAARSQLFGVI